MSRPDSSMLGSAKYERVENDFYPTEPACTIALYEFLKSRTLLFPTMNVYEPACGDGAISKVFSERGHQVYSSDLHPQMDAPVKDFLTDDFMIDMNHQYRSLVVTNPPYAMPWVNKFIERCIDLVHNDGAVAAMLMRNELDAASTRRSYFEGCDYFYGKLVLNWRPRWVPGSTGSPRHNYAWYIWSTDNRGPLHTINYAERPNV